MYDSFLFKKIADTLFEICKENKINRICFLEIDVNQKSHIDEESLRTNLIESIPELIDVKAKIIVNKNDTEALTAVIHTVEGMYDGTICR